MENIVNRKGEHSPFIITCRHGVRHSVNPALKVDNADVCMSCT